MKDSSVNWRNHRWSYDADYVERTAAPLLASLIEKHGSMFDDLFIYIFQGKLREYIIRFPHHNTPRTNYRIPTENPKRSRARRLQRKLMDVLFSEGFSSQEKGSRGLLTQTETHQ